MVKGGIMKYKNSMTTQCKPGGVLLYNSFTERRSYLKLLHSVLEEGGTR